MFRILVAAITSLLLTVPARAEPAASSPDAGVRPAPAASSPPALTPLALPGSGPAWMDYVALDPARHTLWIPAGNRGKTFVLDTRARTFRTIDGFQIRTEGKRVSGPSSVTVGEKAIYVGSRGDDSVCAFDPATLAKGACARLPAMPDGLAFVPTTHELWTTTPRERALTILSIAADGALAPAGSLKLEGEPEGYAVDPRRGLFFTNFEDKDLTLAIDVKSRKIVATYQPRCGEKGPRGLVLDAPGQRLFVACADGAVVLDLAHQGKQLGRLQTGAGVDELAYSPATNTLFIASGRTSTLTLAEVAASGALSAKRTVPTAEGVRCVAVDADGALYLPDSRSGALLLGARPSP